MKGLEMRTTAVAIFVFALGLSSSLASSLCTRAGAYEPAKNADKRLTKTRWSGTATAGRRLRFRLFYENEGTTLVEEQVVQVSPNESAATVAHNIANRFQVSGSGNDFVATYDSSDTSVDFGFKPAAMSAPDPITRLEIIPESGCYPLINIKSQGIEIVENLFAFPVS